MALFMSTKAFASTGTLFVVGTPIGNLQDMSERAIETLRTVDLIAAEDTRHSKKLLQAYSIQTPMQSLHLFNEAKQGELFIIQLLSGKNMALISDAGTPLIRDPGRHLVSLAHQHNIRVSPIPGPSALTSALSVSGLTHDEFLFAGFLPAKQSQRLKQLEDLKHSKKNLVFFETPHRILETLSDCSEVFDKQSEITVCRELTKQFETVLQNTLEKVREQVALDPNQQKGEFVLVLCPKQLDNKHEMTQEAQQMLKILLGYLSVNQASKAVHQILGISKRVVYEYALKLNDTGAE